MEMNEIIRKEIKELAEIILEQSQKLLNYTNGAPQIEVDIAKENLRKLYDYVDTLVDVNWKSSSIEEETKLEDQIDNQVNELLDLAELQNTQNQLLQEQLEAKNELLKKQVTPATSTPIEFHDEAPIVEKKPQELPLQPKEEPKPKAAPIKEPLIVSESDVDSPSLGDHLQRKPISNLKSAIGINDKFQFINELFEGSMKVYNQAIDEIEQASNANEALKAYGDIATKNNWDKENPAYVQLYDYVERRFL